MPQQFNNDNRVVQWVTGQPLTGPFPWTGPFGVLINAQKSWNLGQNTLPQCILIYLNTFKPFMEIQFFQNWCETSNEFYTFDLIIENLKQHALEIWKAEFHKGCYSH